MEEKKESANWTIALLHLVFVAPASVILTYIFTILIGAPFILLSKFSLNIPGTMSYSLFLLFPIATVLGTWLSVRYSADYLNKNFIIRDIQRVIILSMIYIVIIGVPFILFSIHIGPSAPSLSDYIFVFIQFIIMLVTFYLISKKYIKNDELAVPKHLIDKEIGTALPVVAILVIASIAGIVVWLNIEKIIK